MADNAPQSRRALARKPCAVVPPRTSTFADFLSDSSEDDNDEEDDAHSRATLRMQQQADDYGDANSTFDVSIPSDGESSSNDKCHLRLAKPGFFKPNDDDDDDGPMKVEKLAMPRKEVDKVLETPCKHKTMQHTRPTSGNVKTSRDAHATACYDSFVSNTPSFDANDESLFDERRPSFSDDHSFTDEDSFMGSVDTSFVYRPSLLDDDEVEVESKEMGLSNSSLVHRYPVSDASLSLTMLRSTQEHAAEKTPAIFSVKNEQPPLQTNVSKTTGPMSKNCAVVSHGSGNSLHSSGASSLRSSYDGNSEQRRTTAAQELWRMSSLDHSESKHAYDEELGLLESQSQLPRAFAVHADSEQHSCRLTNAFEERNSMASTSSNSSSVMSVHNQTSFFVDDMHQNLPSRTSLSLDSRPSRGDSFIDVAILGDDDRDQYERRSSDVIPQTVDKPHYRSISATCPTVPDALDHSYSKLANATMGLDRLSKKPAEHTGSYTVDGNDSGADISTNGTRLGSSLASLAKFQPLAASEQLSSIASSGPKPGTSTRQQTRWEALKKRSFVTTSEHLDRHTAAYDVGQVLYRSIALPYNRDVKQDKASRSVESSASTTNFSSAALLAAIKTRDVNPDARSKGAETSDVALGTLHELATPVKTTTAPQSEDSFSSSLLSNSSVESYPSIVAPALTTTSSKTRLSVLSFTSSADRLDFTGVYCGSINSLKSSSTIDVSSRRIQPDAETLLMRSQQKLQGEGKTTIDFNYLSVKLHRSRSDGRTMQREARRKVENFFRDTHERHVLDMDDTHCTTNRKRRARTTVVQCMGNAVDGSPSLTFHSSRVAKTLHFKHLCAGSKRIGRHLKYDAVPLTPQQDDEGGKRRPVGITIRTNSTGTAATQPMPFDHISQSYMDNPHTAVLLDSKLHTKEKAPAQQLKTVANASIGEHSGIFAISSSRDGNDCSSSRTMSGRRVDSVSFALPRLSANESPAASPSPFATSYATPHTLGESSRGRAGNGRSPEKLSAVFSTTSRRFLRKSESSFNDIDEEASDSVYDTSRFVSERSRLVECVRSLSSSLVVRSMRRLMRDKQHHRPNGNVDPTSPQSRCTAPAALPRGFNHNGFYEIPFKVPDLNKPLLQRKKQCRVESYREWVRQWLILLICVVLGLSAGSILVRAVALNARLFSLSSAEVHDRQESNGELVFAASVRWFLLPGHLFVQVWSAIATPLLFCYVVTAVSDLVGCSDKAKLLLSFHSVGYALMLALLATVEGVLAMWMAHRFGWFRGSSDIARLNASMLSDAMGVTSLTKGAMGLLCQDGNEYLKRLGHDVFVCSNASLLLPLFEEVSNNSTDIADSGPAVFALKEVNRVFATPTSTTAYYPASLGTGGNMVTQLLQALTPENLFTWDTEIENDRMVPLGGLVVFALLFGYLCGKRILLLRRHAQTAMFESAVTNDSATDDPHNAGHSIVGLLMELQLALEWLVRPMERYLAPVGFFSLMLGHMVVHHREWHSFTSLMSSLIVGTLIVFFLHATVVLPMVSKVLSSGCHRLPVMTTTRSFLPAFLFAFTTDHVAFAAPVMMQCYARVLTVTRSSAQVATAVTGAISRNTRALYLPLALLWLLETSSSDEVELRTSNYLSIGMLSMLSCFCGGSTRLTLAIAHTLWSTQSSNAASTTPATLPLFVMCNVVLSRFANVVTLMDHLVFTHLAAQHWEEIVVNEPSDRVNNNNNNSSSINISSVSQFDDSQVFGAPSSAMLSSVCL